MIALTDVTTEIVTVTPEVAAEWLAAAGRNRHIRRSKVREYSADMLADAWSLTHQGLCFNTEGQLLDGFHRLHACMHAGVAFTTLVAHGVEEDARPFMDIGVARNPGDILHIEEEVSHPNLLAATLRWIWVLTGNNVISDVGKRLPKVQLFALREAHTAVVESFWVAPHVHKLCRNSLAVALHYLMAHKDANLATRFMTALLKGEGLQDGEIVYRLRGVLTQNAMTHKKKMTSLYQAAVIIQAWNLWRAGKTMSRQAPRWRRDGNNPDPFPTID